MKRTFLTVYVEVEAPEDYPLDLLSKPISDKLRGSLVEEQGIEVVYVEVHLKDEEETDG